MGLIQALKIASCKQLISLKDKRIQSLKNLVEIQEKVIKAQYQTIKQLRNDLNSK